MYHLDTQIGSKSSHGTHLQVLLHFREGERGLGSHSWPRGFTGLLGATDAFVAAVSLLAGGIAARPGGARSLAQETQHLIWKRDMRSIGPTDGPSSRLLY